MSLYPTMTIDGNSDDNKRYCHRHFTPSCSPSSPTIDARPTTIDELTATMRH